MNRLMSKSAIEVVRFVSAAATKYRSTWFGIDLCSDFDAFNFLVCDGVIVILYHNYSCPGS